MSNNNSSSSKPSGATIITGPSPPTTTQPSKNFQKTIKGIVAGKILLLIIG